MNCDVKHQSVYGKRSKWRSNGVDWEKFRDEIEQRMQGLEEMTLLNRIIKFNSVVIDSAKTHVRKVKPGKKTKVYMTPVVREKIQKNRTRFLSTRARGSRPTGRKQIVL